MEQSELGSGGKDEVSVLPLQAILNSTEQKEEIVEYLISARKPATQIRIHCFRNGNVEFEKQKTLTILLRSEVRLEGLKYRLMPDQV